MAVTNMMLAAEGGSNLTEVVDSLDQVFGMSLFEEEIDQVIFRTNEFLVSGGADTGGPFWYIMQFSMTLGALFAVIMAAGMAYKMMVKGEAFDPLKIFRVFGIAAVMFFWYGSTPGGTSGVGVLDFLAYVPNAIGSWTHDMYELEAMQVQETYNQLKHPMEQINDSILAKQARYEAAVAQTEKHTADDTSLTQYLTHAMMTAGYLLVASVVSMKCLNLVPDLAAWMIPEGDTAFSTRNFGEGVASSVKQTGMSSLTRLSN